MKGIKLIGLVVFLLIATSDILHASPLNLMSDTIVSKIKIRVANDNAQYSISISGTSENLQWTAIRKWYYLNSDTTLIFNRKSIQKPEFTLQKMSHLTFMNQNLLLAFGDGRAEFYDLKSKIKKSYKNVLQVAALKMRKKHVLYAILKKEGHLEIFNLNGHLIHEIDGVKSLQTSVDVGFIIHYETSGKNYIQKVNDTKIENLFHQDTDIQNVLITDDQRYLLIGSSFLKTLKDFQKNGNEKVSTIYIIDLLTNKFIQLPIDPAERFDDFEFSPMGKGSTYLLSLRKSFKPDNEMLEIWNGNESNIQSLYRSHSLKKFFIWKSDTKELIPLESQPEEQFMAFTNSKYLLKYHPNKGHNYTNLYPTIKMRLYDITAQKEFLLGDFSGVDQGYPETIYSPNGKWIIASPDHKQWILYNLETMTKTSIEGQNLNSPLFTKDDKFIYFGSENGIWKYDIQSQSLSLMVSEKGIHTFILNAEKKRQFNIYYFASHSIDSAKPIWYKKFDKENSETGNAVFKNGKIINLIPMTENRIKDIVANTKFDKFYFLEENYNIPTQLFEIKIEHPKSKIYQSNVRDQLANQLDKKIVIYKNNKGSKLRGTLYYPAHFDPNKKYPMVVKIYRIQRSYANEYIIKGGASYVAYDKRGLVERGYFVYEPDIMYGDEGTGMGALDCVNRAMDAIQNNKSINFKKVALLGHSHGGYSTNFIATHSDRFATYISGAGNSDIVRSYFSYNRNFSTPFYMQFENGQYEMPPFTENKEMYFKNNPIHYVEQVSAPILLWAGKKDENIFWEQVQEFYIGLKRNKKDVVALFYTKVGHDLGINTPEKADMHTRATEWLDYFLKDKKDVDWINKQMRN